jgi:patatin-related protein
MNNEPSGIEQVEETRIALAFYGGVALAVYESGVAIEFFRLVRGDGVYARLRERIGPAVVDIITGASAGGLNGAFLANALVNRGDIMQLLSVWLEEGDIDKLLQGALKTDPPSLLDGDRFLRKIFGALLAKRPAPAGEGALQPTLDLYMAATNLDGDRVVVTTPDGEPIATRTHRQVFRFRFQKEAHDGGIEGLDDFRTEADLRLLAQAARASASFPFAFEPVLVAKDGLGRRAARLEADAYHIDGGVLDNKPIALAVSAIASRRADRKITRLLFYIEPDPEKIESRLCQTAPRTYGPLEVVLKALVGLPGYQSITGALEDIVEHNRAVADRRVTLDYFERGAAVFRNNLETRAAGAAQPAAPAAPAEEFRYIPPRDAATALFRSQEEGYMDLRLRRDVSAPLLDALNAVAELVKEAGPDADRLLYAIKSLLLDALDVRFHGRMYRYLVQIVRGLYPARPRGTGDGSGRAWHLYTDATRRLNAVKALLYSQEELLRRQAQSEQELQRAELERLEAQLRQAVEMLRTGREEGGVNATSLLRELRQRLEQTDLIRRRREFLGQLRRTIELRLRNDRRDLLDQLAAGPRLKTPSKNAGSTVDASQAIESGFMTLLDALHSFYLRDLILYPMRQSDDIAAELQPINFARISPADACAFMPGLSAQEKLAGEKLAHFGGFLSAAWRGNDLTWGRLDAAEIIIRKLWPEPDNEAAVRALIQDAQNEIIAEMAARDLGINTTANPRDRRHLIGRQGMAVIPLSDKVQWTLRALATTSKILRRAVAESRAGPWLGRITTAMNVASNVLTGACVAAAIGFRWLFRRPVAGWMLAGLALMAAGILLWEYILRHWWIE